MKRSLSAMDRGADVRHVDAVPDVEGGIERGHRQDRRRADAHALDAGGGAVAGIEGEGRAWPIQPGSAGCAAVGMARRD